MDAEGRPHEAALLSATWHTAYRAQTVHRRPVVTMMVQHLKMRRLNHSWARHKNQALFYEKTTWFFFRSPEMLIECRVCPSINAERVLFDSEQERSPS